MGMFGFQSPSSLLGGFAQLGPGSAPPNQSTQSTVLNSALRALGVPAHMRIYADALAGRAAPITQADFTAGELAEMRAAIENSRTRYAHDKSSAPVSAEQRQQYPGFYQAIDAHDRRLDRYQQTGRGDVQYGDYRTKGSLQDDPIANTLGRFVYQPDGRGGYVATDAYDFDNPARHEQVQQYKQMSPMQKLIDVLTPSTDGAGAPGTNPEYYVSSPSTLGSAAMYYLRDVASKAGDAFIGDRAIPVRVDVPPGARK